MLLKTTKHSLNSLFSRKTCTDKHQKSKTILDFNEGSYEGVAVT